MSEARRHPLARQVTQRLALALLVTINVTAVLAYWFFAQANQRFLDLHVRQAEQHYASTLALQEIQWEAAAYNFKARLEYSRVLEVPVQRQRRLVNFITAQGGVPEYPLVAVFDGDDQRIAEFESGLRHMPPVEFSNGDSGWAFDGQANILYRVFRQQVWLGTGRNGKLLLFRPVDHAALGALAFPETHMVALWHQRPVASSLGEEGISLIAAERAGDLPHQRLLPWSETSPDNPRVLIATVPNTPFTLPELFLSLSLGVLVFIATAWLVFGQWVASMVRRVVALGSAHREFSALREVTPAVTAALDAADLGRGDELAELAASGRDMMAGVADHERRQQLAAARLHRSEERYRFLVEGARVVAWEFSARSARFTYVSSYAEELLGYPLGDWLQPDFVEAHVHPDDAERIIAAREQAVATGRGCSLDYRLRHRDGYYVWVHHLSAPPAGDAAAGDGIIRGILLDVSERKLLEQRLTIAGLVFEKATEGIMVTDAQNRIISVNPAFESITGYPQDEVLGRDPKIFSAGLQAADHYEAMWRALERDEFWTGEVWNRRKSGESFAQRLSVSIIRDESGRAARYLAMFSDVTTQKRQAEKIEHQAAHDALTGLPNRRLLGDRIAQAMVRAQRLGRGVGVVMLDLDGFKHINDTLGHRIGDLLLIETAQRLVHCVRESDTVARLGGDEFMVVLPEIQGQNDLQTLAGKILDHIREPYCIEGKDLFISCSIGLTLFPDDGANAEILLAHADTAMYRAKSGGKNTYRFFTSEMHEHAVARLRLEEELRRALRNGEFVLHYQPVVDLASGMTVKSEALIRWQHPQLGLTDPAAFIPVAEETGLIMTLGAWVVEEAARQAARWRKQAPPGFRIAVNLSAQQFQRGDCVALIRDTLAAAGALPQQLAIEITESLFIDDQGDALRQLTELKRLGIEVAIDDFGTGYSSLGYLKNFPVDTLKIDQSFVGGLDGNPGGMALVEAIISMSRALGLAVVAEGVESEAQRHFLDSRGCQYAQGYLFGRALPAGEFETRFLSGALLPAD